MPTRNVPAQLAVTDETTDRFAKVNYKRHFLSAVVVRIDFENPIDLLKEKMPRTLENKLVSLFPIREPQQAATQRIHGKGLSIVSLESEPFTIWRFRGKDETKAATVTSKALFIEYMKYHTYEELRSDLMFVCDALYGHFPEITLKRSGLRYINNIDWPEGATMDWKGIISPKLLGLFDYRPDKAKVTRLFHDIELVADEYLLRFQFGMPNPDFPAEIKRKLFVLDFDAYMAGLQTMEELGTRIDRFHERIQFMFESSITDNVRMHLNGKR